MELDRNIHGHGQSVDTFSVSLTGCPLRLPRERDRSHRPAHLWGWRTPAALSRSADRRVAAVARLADALTAPQVRRRGRAAAARRRAGDGAPATEPIVVPTPSVRERVPSAVDHA
jgi:hypothetical protein